MKFQIVSAAILLPSIILGTVSPSWSQVAFKQQPIAQELKVENRSKSIHLKQSKRGGVKAFLQALGQRETGGLGCPNGQYSCVNQLGFKGKYQFGQPLLTDLVNNRCITRQQANNILNLPRVQEKAMGCALKLYQKYLTAEVPNVKSYIGKTRSYNITTNFDSNVDGRKDTRKRWQGRYRITLSGLLAGAHIGGAGNVAKYLKTGKIWVDGNGTPIVDYIDQFSGYF
ncbi:MAG: hypothetical protein WBF90_01900 [Rivularia sp. (in: cyanobacteria)]